MASSLELEGFTAGDEVELDDAIDDALDDGVTTRLLFKNGMSDTP